MIRLFRIMVKEFGLEKVKIRIVPMKRKIASFSFKTRTLRLNRNAVEILDEEQLKFIILHELIHLKIKDINHGSLFLEELRKHYSKEEAEQIELEIIKTLVSKFPTINEFSLPRTGIKI